VVSPPCAAGRASGFSWDGDLVPRPSRFPSMGPRLSMAKIPVGWWSWAARACAVLVVICGALLLGAGCAAFFDLL
jgi:hypothetical protein